MILNKQPSTIVLHFKKPQGNYAVYLDKKPFVEITDLSGKEVMTDTIAAPLVGAYGISCIDNVSRIELKPSIRKSITLPKKERLISKKTKSYFDPNLNEIAVTNQKTGEIWFGKKFAELPLSARYFVKAHEEGHQFYDSEESADMYAFNELLKKGFSPYQCVSSLEKHLTPCEANENRIKTLKETACKL